jgi:hypothetical protein
VHDVEVLGERLADRLGQGLGAPVFHEAAADLVLDRLAHLVDPAPVLVTEQPLVERRHVVGVGPLAPGLRDQSFEDPVELKVPQRPVEVVGAADGPALLDAGEAGHGLAGHHPHEGLVTLEQRLEQHRRELLGGHLVRCSPAALLALPVGALLAALPVLGLGPVAAAVLARAEAPGEVDVEGRLEGVPVAGRLDQRRAERVLERLAVLDRDVVDGLGRVEVLGQRDG